MIYYENFDVTLSSCSTLNCDVKIGYLTNIMPRSHLYVSRPVRATQGNFREMEWDVATLSKKIEWIIHSIYGVKKFHSLRSEFHSILTPVEWNIHYSTSGISSGSLNIHSKRSDHWRHCAQGITSVTNRVKIHSIFSESTSWQLRGICVAITVSTWHLLEGCHFTSCNSDARPVIAT